MRGDYLSVGAIALRDDDGFIRLIDRRKNLITTGGENVYPSEVENVLAAHPDVRDVAVIGTPDRKWGERVEAAVVLRDGAAVTAADLIAWAREKLAGYKRPARRGPCSARTRCRETPTGKILHRVLRDMLADENQDRHNDHRIQG